MTYAGDSPGKKIARCQFWFAAQDALGLERFREGRHLVLSGPDLGDLPVLHGLGAKHVVAVDRDQEAVTKAKWRFPEADVRCGDVLDVIEGGFTTIFLDFCAPLTQDNITTAAVAAACGFEEEGLLGYTFLIGREQDTTGGLRSKVLRFLEEYDQIPEHRPEWKGLNGALTRLRVLHEQLTVDASQLVFEPLTLLYYVSGEEGERRRSPMGVALFRVRRLSDNELAKARAESAGMCPEVVRVESTRAALGAFAIEFMEAGLDPCVFLDITKGTLTAFKAHATRRKQATR